MTEIHFINPLIVVAAAFAAPFLLGLGPRAGTPGRSASPLIRVPCLTNVVPLLMYEAPRTMNRRRA
jgi:hypothetical protein